MSLLNNNYTPELELIGHRHDVRVFVTIGNIQRNVRDRGIVTIKPNFNILDGLVGHRKTGAEYMMQIKRMFTALIMTCPVDAAGKIRIPDIRINKMYRLITAIYGMGHGSLGIEFTTDPFRFAIKSTNPGWYQMVYAQLGTPSWDRGPRIASLPVVNADHGYYTNKPQALRTHSMLVEKFLNFDIEAAILEHQQSK